MHNSPRVTGRRIAMRVCSLGGKAIWEHLKVLERPLNTARQVPPEQRPGLLAPVMLTVNIDVPTARRSYIAVRTACSAVHLYRGSLDR
jgi:hypothetical protein